jgi:hypothetical protein
MYSTGGLCGLLLVEIRCGVVAQRWSFLEHWRVPVAKKKMKGKDIVVCFNVILLYVEAVSVVRGVTI